MAARKSETGDEKNAPNHGSVQRGQSGLAVIMIFVQRELETQRSTVGRFVMCQENAAPGVPVVRGYTLEPPSRRANPGVRHPCIPAGTYEAFVRESTRKGKRVHRNRVFQLREVPGRTAIQIHVGNFPSDTTGCILPGSDRSRDSVGNSTKKMTEMWAFYDKFEAQAKKKGRRVGIKVWVRDLVPGKSGGI